jgi:hypothetical protein
MTQGEAPWLEAKKREEEGEKNFVGLDSMEKHFYRLVKQMGDGIDPRDVWKGEEQYLSGGELVPAEAVFAE